jgi:hypothetical protein
MGPMGFFVSNCTYNIHGLNQAKTSINSSMTCPYFLLELLIIGPSIKAIICAVLVSKRSCRQMMKSVPGI